MVSMFLTMGIKNFNGLYNFIKIKWVELISKHLLRVLTTFLMDTVKDLILVIDFKLRFLSKGLVGVLEQDRVFLSISNLCCLQMND